MVQSAKVFFAGLMSIMAVVCLAGCKNEPPPSDFEQIKSAFVINDFATVRRLAKEIPQTHEHWAEIQVLLGRFEGLSRGPKFAIPYLRSVPRDRSPVSYEAVRSLAEEHVKMGTLFHAMEDYRYMLVRDPLSMLIHTQIVGVALKAGVRTEAEEHLLWLLRNARLDLPQLVVLSVPERRDNFYTDLKQAVLFNADDPYVNLGLAIEEVRASKLDSARDRLGKVIKTHPEIVEAQALLGELLVDRGEDALKQWKAQLPDAALAHFGVWYVRGLWASAQQNPQVASRSFWEALKQRPHDRRANERLAEVLAPLQPDVAAQFAQLAAALRDYAETAEQALKAPNPDKPKLFAKNVDLLVGMGRHPEARGWDRLASEMLEPTHPLRHAIRTKIKMDKDQPRFDPENDLTRIHDLSAYPDTIDAAATN